LFFYSWLSF